MTETIKIQHADGSATVFGPSITVGPVDGGRRGKTDAERQAELAAEQMSGDVVRERFGWTLEQLRAAHDQLGFPRATSYRWTGRIRPRRESIFSRAAIERWRTELIAFAAAIK